MSVTNAVKSESLARYG